MPGFFGVQLPAYRAPSPIDFSPLSEGLDALGKTIEKNRLLDQAKAVGEALRSGQTTNADGTATTHPQVNQLLSPLYPTPDSVKASPAQASAAAAGRDYPNAQYGNAIANIETGSFKQPYTALGPTVKSGDRAYGKYQVMGQNIGPWTKEVLGREMTPQEFLANPQAQDAVFNAKFGQYVAKTGNPQDAASMWFTGRPAAQSGDARARDANGNQIGITGREYVARFNAGLGQQPAAQSAVPQSATIQPVSAPASQNYGAGIDMALKQGNLALATQLMQQQRAEQATNQQNQLFPYQLQEAQFGADKNRVALENAATQQLGVLANTIQQAPAGAQAGMWQRILQTHPEMAATLQQHGVNPNDVAAGTNFFINQAKGLGLARKYGTTLNYLQKPDGTIGAFVMGENGEPREVSSPGGGSILPPTTQLNLGTSYQPVTSRGAVPVGKPIAKDVAGEAQQKELGTESGKAKMTLPNVETATSRVLGLLDDIDKDPMRSSFTGYSGYLPNTSPAANTYQSKLDQITNNVFLQGFNDLRGAGAITEAEGKKATGALTRLSTTALTDEGFQKALDDTREVMRSILNNARRRAGLEPLAEQPATPTENNGYKVLKVH